MNVSGLYLFNSEICRRHIMGMSLFASTQWIKRMRMGMIFVFKQFLVSTAFSLHSTSESSRARSQDVTCGVVVRSPTHKADLVN